MKRTLFGCVIVLLTTISCSTGDPTGYDKKIAKKQGLTEAYEDYKKVFAVSFGNDPKDDAFYDQAFNGEDWVPSIEKKVQLNHAQIRIVQSIISDPSILSNESNKCEFLPHHSVVFFGKGNKYLGEISVCFMCNQYLTPNMVYEADMSRESSDQLKALFKTVGFEVGE